MAEGIDNRTWSTLNTLGKICAALIFMGGTIIGVIHYEMAPFYAYLAELKENDKRHDANDQKHDHQLAAVWKREQVNTACVNGLTGFINSNFKKSFMSPYDLFTKPEGLEFDDIQ